MIKNYLFCFCFLLSFSAQTQIINFPDSNFKNLLLTNILVDTNSDGTEDSDVDTNNDGEIDQTEALQVNWLTVSDNNITNLTGIEYFTQITDLFIDGVQATSVNLSNFSLLWRIWCNNTAITEINLCGTNVMTLWCDSNPNLNTLYLKNNVISSDLAKNGSQIPPPLHNFEFWNSPSLNYICYDEGEYDAVFHGIGQDDAGITLTTSCSNTCTLSNQGNSIIVFTFYPNPTERQLHIQMTDNGMVKEVSVYNALGQKLMISNKVTIDVTNLSNGTYFITVESDGGKATKPFIKM